MLAQAMQGGGGFAMPQHPGYGEDELAQAQAAASSAGRQQDLMQAMFANGARDRHMGWGDAIAQLAYAYGAHKAGKKHDSALADVLAKERGLDKYDSQLRAIQERADEQRRRRESMEDFKAKENFKRESAGPSDYELFSKDPESYAAYKAAGRAPGTTVNVNSGDKGPQVGTIPQGFQMVQENGAYRMEAIPGGPADIEAQQAAETENAALSLEARQFSDRMGKFADLISSPGFESAVGPVDAHPAKQAFNTLSGNEAYKVQRDIDRLMGKEVLTLGAEVLKGSQTEGEWARVAEAMPQPTDHPEVWKRWYGDAMDTILAGRPDLTETLEPMRAKVLGGSDAVEPGGVVNWDDL